MNNPLDFIRQFRRTDWRRDYPFPIARVRPLPPLRKNRRRGVCGEGATVHRLVSRLALAWKRQITEFPCAVFLMIAKDCTEGLSAVALSVGLNFPRGYCVSGHVVLASSPPKSLDWDCVGRRLTGTRHGNVYRSVREKQGNVVYRQCVLQTVTSLRVVSL